MIRYKRDEFSRLAEECGLTQEQTKSITESVFDRFSSDGAELSDIAGKLTEIIRGLPDTVSAGLFEQAGNNRASLIAFGKIMFHLLILQLEHERDQKGVDPYRMIAGEPSISYQEIFESDVLATFTLEAASQQFEKNLLAGGTEGDEICQGIQKIFEEARLYESLLSYFSRIKKQSKERTADAFFLRLLLLYCRLAQDSEKSLEYNKEKTIIDMIKNGPEEEGDTHKTGTGHNGYSRTTYNDILEVLKKNVIYIPEPDIKNLLSMLSGAINSMAIRSEDILIEQLASQNRVLKSCLRMKYIDAQILKNLCEKMEESSTFSVRIPEWGNQRVALITKKKRILIRLDADETGITAEFYSEDKKLRREVTDSADWETKEEEQAAAFCKNALAKLPKGSSFLFSYIYLQNYRTIEELAVSFDHRYSLEKRGCVEEIILNSKQQKLSSAYFYGKNIYSLTCLVGCNGAGKSSVIDFLRESFLIIKAEAEGGKIKWENGYLNLCEEDIRRFHLQTSTKFLVIFRVGKKDFYLTNIPNIQLCDQSELHPYTPVKQKGQEESGGLEGLNFTEEDCTFVYFSQFCYPAGMSTAMHFREESAYMKTVPDYIKDLSEENLENQDVKSGVGNRKELGTVNESLLHQLIYLLAEKKEVERGKKRGKTKEKTFDFPTADECVQYDNLGVYYGTSEKKPLLIKDIFSSGCSNEEMDEKLISIFLNEPGAFIGPVSSGQHSRLKLLSRLYWCLNGSKTFINKFGDKWKGFCDEIKKHEAGCQTRLDAENTGVLFFDEGDLCYHPEWQRSYLRDITSMVKKLREKDVQIIVTTNSPFMLSDMLREDVFSLVGNASYIPGKDPIRRTYGQNIHMLLAHSFFLENTMGKMSENTLIWLFDLMDTYLKQKEQKNNAGGTARKKMLKSVNKYYGDYLNECRRKSNLGSQKMSEGQITMEETMRFLENLIDEVGERTYRVALKDEYERCFKSEKAEHSQVR